MFTSRGVERLEPRCQPVLRRRQKPMPAAKLNLVTTDALAYNDAASTKRSVFVPDTSPAWLRADGEEIRRE